MHRGLGGQREMERILNRLTTEIMTGAEIESLTLNWQSQPGAPEIFLKQKIKMIVSSEIFSWKKQDTSVMVKKTNVIYKKNHKRSEFFGRDEMMS